MRCLAVWALERSIASAVTGPIDVLMTANAVWAYLNRKGQKVGPLFEWRVESLDGKPVRTPSGYTIDVDGAIGARAAVDAVLLPGFFVDDMPAFLKTLERLKPLLPALRKLHERGTLIAANCSTSFLLADAGLLDHRKATVHWSLAKVFQQRYPKVDLCPHEILTEQDGILCGAATAYMDLALRLVEKFAGASLAAATAKSLLVDANRASQASYKTTTVQDYLPQTDALVARAQRWMEKRLRLPFRLRDLASDLAVSERTVSRRFNEALGQSPVAYLQALRIEIGKRLLETTRLSVEAVSERVGYGDVNFFRRVFKRQTGLSPREYHQRFRRRYSWRVAWL